MPIERGKYRVKHPGQIAFRVNREKPQGPVGFTLLKAFVRNRDLRAVWLWVKFVVKYRHLP